MITDELKVYEGWSISNENQHITLKFFHNLYISKKNIFNQHIWICCGCDVVVIYGVTTN